MKQSLNNVVTIVSWIKKVEPVAAGMFRVFSYPVGPPVFQQVDTKRMSKMEKKSGFGQTFAKVAIMLLLLAGLESGVNVAYSADAPKDKLATAGAIADKNAKASENNAIKQTDKTGNVSDPTELLAKGSKTFMEGAEMIKSKKDKAAAEKLMLDGHKMMAETETAWTKANKDLSPAQKAVTEGHGLMMKGYTLLKSDKDTDQGAKLVTDGYKKFTDGLKGLQSSVSEKDRK